MKNKCFKFLKKWFPVILVIAFGIVGASLMFYGAIKGSSLQYLERDYQIATFGYYDSSIKYLIDVDDSLNYFMRYIGIGISILIADFIYAFINLLDSYYTRKKSLEDKNNG